MRDVVEALRRQAPARPALIEGGTVLTYGALLDRVEALSLWARRLPRTIGILGTKTAGTVALDLALSRAGRTIVPLPDFFSRAQLDHIVADAAVDAVVSDAPVEGGFAVPLLHPGMVLDGPRGVAGEARRIIYTSGTTGRPKGVVLGEAQMRASVAGLAAAVSAAPADRMLSVLPYSLLLEQIAGIFLPLTVGASVVLCADPRALPAAAEAARPTATVLVPEMLAGWVGWLERTGKRAPAGLRFVAVGGAPIAPSLAERAWALGIPVHEGYGLSECCSVVAVNRLGERRSGTAGAPLPGVSVTIVDGEIVVGGPTVMDGYLGGAPVRGVWRTGDAGHLDEAGRLIVEGRIDDVIVTSTGRNIHPEWIESLLLADPRIARCAVVGGGRHPRAVLVPSASLPTPLPADAEAVDALVGRLCASLPDYARPRGSVLMSEAELARDGLITANGRLRRRALGLHLGNIQ